MTRRSSEVVAAERILDNAHARNRKLLETAWVDSRGKQCFSDGYRCIRLTEHLDIPMQDTEGMHLDDYVQFGRVSEMVTVNLPTVKELRQMIRDEHKKPGMRCKSVRYDFPDVDLHCNAQYLIDMMTLLPYATATWYPSKRNYLFFYDMERDDDGMLCLVRVRSGEKGRCY